MRIELLADYAGSIPVLAEWYVAEWAPYYGAGGPGDAMADLECRCRRDELPVGLVALDGDTVIGTAALGADVATNLVPSIVGLLVRADRRRRGVAGALIAYAVDVARRLGFRRVYVSTSVLGEWLTRNGWQVAGSVEFLDAARGTIFVRSL